MDAGTGKERGRGEGGRWEDLHHALMNPLTVVVGYAQLLAARKDLSPEARSQAMSLLDRANECVRIIEEWEEERTGPEQGGASSPDGSTAGVSDMEGTESRRETRPRVLVVDDEPTILRLAFEFLKDEYDVLLASSREEMFAHLAEGEFGAILLDVNLGKKGAASEIFDLMKIEHARAAARVIFMSGNLFEDGGTGFPYDTGRPCVQKPFDLEKLEEVVERTTAGD